MANPLQSGCAPGEVIAMLAMGREAAGLMSESEAEAWMAHVSMCENCASLLREAIKNTNQDLSTDEQSDAEEIPPPKEAPRSSSTINWRLLASVAAMVTILATSWLFWNFSRLPSVRSTLANYYSKNRQMAMRIEGAPHGPLIVTRGAATTSSNADVLEASAKIERELAANSQQLDWLAMKGRLALLGLESRTAIEVLRRAADLSKGDDANHKGIAIDLASAYTLRASQNQNSADLTLAVEILSELLAKDGNNLVARFNRAIVEEELSLWIPAIEDFEVVSIRETDAAWKAEAIEGIARIRKKMDRAFDPTRPLTAEEQIDLAMRGGLWLNASLDLKSLSERLARNHKDSWLSETLALPRTAAVNEAVSLLSRMTEMRLSNSNARYESLDSLILKLGGLPAPLAAWASFEILYRDTHVPERYTCSAPLRQPSRFGWLVEQSLRESGICLFLSGDTSGGRNEIQKAIRTATELDLPVSQIRATGMEISMLSRAGKYRDAINTAQSALSFIASKQLPFARMHEFLTVSTVCQVRLGRLHAARRTAQMAAEVARRAKFESIYHLSLNQWAELAHRTGQVDEVRMAYQAAVDADSSGPSLTKERRAWAELNLADALGQADRLPPLELVLASSLDSRLRTQYHQTKARFEIESGQLAVAKKRLQGVLANELTPRGKNPDPLWRDQTRIARTRLAKIFLLENQPGIALSAIMPKMNPPPEAVGFALALIDGKLGVWRKEGDICLFRWADLTPSEYQSRVRLLVAMLTSPRSAEDAILRLSTDLAQRLFGTWLSELATGKPLCFSADPALKVFPFSMLQGKMRPIGLDSPVTIGCRETRPFQPNKILLVDATEVPISAEWKVAPLSSPDKEIQAAQGLGSAQVLRGRYLTASEVDKALEGVDLLHFAGHAILQADGAAILAGKDDKHPNGLLKFSRQKMSSRSLIVLSACSTATPAQDELDTVHPLSLANQLMAQGAGEIVATYWEIENEAAITFMSRFYQALTVKYDVGSAMLSAIRSLADTKRYRHPYYWSVFSHLVTQEE